MTARHLTGRARRRSAQPIVAIAAVLAVVGTFAATSAGSIGATARSPTDHASGLVVPRTLYVAPGAPKTQVKRVVAAAQTLYTFWNTGDVAYLHKVLSPSFIDHTLPPGRPQGPNGPAVASQTFRTAVPDLTCEVAALYVVGDTFTAHLVFRGHFTGSYDGVKGQGQTIDFNAFDIQHVDAQGRINEDWHLEDNLTFLTQAGLVTIAGKKPKA